MNDFIGGLEIKLYSLIYQVIKWLKQVGDQVADGDVVCEVETDKSTMDVPTTISGTIKEIKVKEGEIVPVGSILAIVE